MEELTPRNLNKLNSKRGLQLFLSQDDMTISKALRILNHESKLERLQEELIKLQQWVEAEGEKLVVIFEGRDAAGKGGAIRRITQHLNPRELNVVALSKPTDEEKNQWYFQRYIKNLPRNGQITFFDRSWYNRAVVEPVNGFCTEKEYEVFMGQVNQFEKMIIDSGIRVVKIYFSITKEEQSRRFEDIKSSPVKKWKFSKVDQTALERWDDYTSYKTKMFEQTDTEIAPWYIINANRKSRARVESIEKLLELVPYNN
ncbi:polyphosphate kinase 2 [Flavobacteriaceae bacterium]|nr:polyphosphate kinase 2 [Flavobacteriaceae bacterium]MDB9874174.1 polyphosphate kinase 2 [Flavobacteriaceae bacterium]MDC1266271.1 polyphosphate kinase 2 [Flavobacteriaceae bacterium]